MSYQPRSTNPYIMEKKLNECVGDGGFDPSVLEEMQAEISVLGSQNETQAQDIIDIKGSLNSLNDKLNSKQDAFSLLTFTKELPTHSTDAAWDIASVNFGVTFQQEPIVMIYPCSTGFGPIAVSITELTRSGCKFGTYRNADGAGNNTFIIKVLGVVN